MEEKKDLEEVETEELEVDEAESISEKDRTKEKKIKIGIAVVLVALIGGVCIFANQQSQHPQTIKQDKKVETKTSKTTTKKSNKDKKSEDKTEAETTSESKHEHEWVQQYKTVHHDAQTHTEQVLVREAYDDPVYTQVQHLICDNCGADITSNTKAHLMKHLTNGETGTYHAEYKNEQTATIHHEAEYQTNTVVDKDAYDEQVANGWKCSICGATKQ